VNNKVIGVLAIQGDFQAHKVMLSGMAADIREVRRTPDLDGITHLIIPGGESTTIRKVAKQNGLWTELATFKGPVMGTCMGSIVMARQSGPRDEETLGLIDMRVERNAYGRQINSFTADGEVEFADGPFEMVFIRAPKIIKTGRGVEAIARMGHEITGVKSGNRIAFTFHPELTDDDRIHRYFLELD
jgi:5'-phosphate synthase pdxT subunit